MAKINLKAETHINLIDYTVSAYRLTLAGLVFLIVRNRPVKNQICPERLKDIRILNHVYGVEKV